MIETQKEMLVLLKDKGCSYELYEHPPVFTVDEAMQHCAHIPGEHVKNLFLRNKKKTAYWLITVLDEKRVDLQALGERLGGGRLSFGSENDLRAMLGVAPGSVTPLAIINDAEKRIQQFFDQDLLKAESLSIHPMDNRATIHLKLKDLLAFIEKAREEKSGFIEIPILESPDQ